MKQTCSEESSVRPTMELPISAGYESAITRHIAKPLIKPAGTATALYGPGDIYSLLVTGEESNHTLFQFEAIVPPGGGPPLHVHSREDESFYIVSGSLEVVVDEERYITNKGDFVYVPRGVIHAFKNIDSHSAVMLVTLTPAGLDTFFREIFPLVQDINASVPVMTEKMLQNMNETALKYGIRYI